MVSKVQRLLCMQSRETHSEKAETKADSHLRRASGANEVSDQLFMRNYGLRLSSTFTSFLIRITPSEQGNIHYLRT